MANASSTQPVPTPASITHTFLIGGTPNVSVSIDDNGHSATVYLMLDGLEIGQVDIDYPEISDAHEDEDCECEGNPFCPNLVTYVSEEMEITLHTISRTDLPIIRRR